MHIETTKPPGTTRVPCATTFERTYPGKESQVSRVRADLARVADECPFADDLILIASELAANAVVHSRSGRDGGVFTVRAGVWPADHAWLEVEDQGGRWDPAEPDDEHGRGLAIVRALAGDGNWAIEPGTWPGSLQVSVRFGWTAEAAAPGPAAISARKYSGKGDDVTAAQCSCGFTELADEEMMDHLLLVFEPEGQRGADGIVHEERDRLACACGLYFVTPGQLDAHFLAVFTPADAIGGDGQRHVPGHGSHGG